MAFTWEGWSPPPKPVEPDDEAGLTVAEIIRRGRKKKPLPSAEELQLRQRIKDFQQTMKRPSPLEAPLGLLSLYQRNVVEPVAGMALGTAEAYTKALEKGTTRGRYGPPPAMGKPYVSALPVAPPPPPGDTLWGKAKKLPGGVSWGNIGEAYRQTDYPPFVKGVTEAVTDITNILPGVGFVKYGSQAARGAMVAARGAKRLAPEVGRAIQDAAEASRPTLRPRLGVTPGEVPGPAKAGLTAEAEDFVSKITAGGTPTSDIANNHLRRIARENGIKVTPGMTWKEVFQEFLNIKAKHVEAVTPTGVKEPWQMTREEFESLPTVYRGVSPGSRTKGSLYIASDKSRASTFAGEGEVLTGKVTRPNQIRADPEMMEIEGRKLTGVESLNMGQAQVNHKFFETRNHKQIIDKALSEGKPVPAEVLKDYPDLVAKRAVGPAVPAKGIRPTHKQAVANALRAAKEREAQVFRETEAKFAEEAASTETIAEREIRRAATAKGAVEPAVTDIKVLKRPDGYVIQKDTGAFLANSDGTPRVFKSKKDAVEEAAIASETEQRISNMFSRQPRPLAVPAKAAPTSLYKQPPGRHEVPQFGESGAVPEYTPSAAGRRKVIEARLRRGEPVPDRLLAEFPDLARTAPGVEPAVPAVEKAATILRDAQRIDARADVSIPELAKSMGLTKTSKDFSRVIHELIQSGDVSIVGGRPLPGKSVYYNRATRMLSNKPIEMSDDIVFGLQWNRENLYSRPRIVSAGAPESAAVKGAVEPAVPAGQARAVPPTIKFYGESYVPPALQDRVSNLVKNLPFDLESIGVAGFTTEGAVGNIAIADVVRGVIRIGSVDITNSSLLHEIGHFYAFNNPSALERFLTITGHKPRPFQEVEFFANSFAQYFGYGEGLRPMTKEVRSFFDSLFVKVEPAGQARAVPPLKVITFDEFSISRGVDATPPSFPELHRKPGGVSKVSEKASAQKVQKANAEWQVQRNALRLEYDTLVNQGVIRSPSRIEELTKVAQGGGEAAISARRLLAKQQSAAVPGVQTGRRPPVTEGAFATPEGPITEAVSAIPPAVEAGLSKALPPPPTPGGIPPRYGVWQSPHIGVTRPVGYRPTPNAPYRTFAQAAGQAPSPPPGLTPPPGAATGERLWLPEPPRTAAYMAYARGTVRGSFRKKTGALDTVEQARQQVLKARDLGENTVAYVHSYIRQAGDLTEEFGLDAQGLAAKVGNPNNRSLAINDVLSNPTHYSLTASQKEIAKRHGFVYRQALKLARSYGVEIAEIGGPDELWQYIARRVKSRVDPVTGQVIEPPPVTGGFRMGAKISAQKERIFEEMAQGLDLGYLYAHPDEVIGQHIKGVYRLIGNKQAEDTVESLTRAIAKDAPLVFGERRLGQPALQQRAAAVEIANAIDKIFKPEQPIRALQIAADVSGVIVGQEAALDISAPFIQGLPVLGHDLKMALKGKPTFIWARAFGNMWQAIKNPRAIDNYRTTKPELYKRALEAGILTGQSELVAGVPLAERALGRIPKVGKTLADAYRQAWGRMGQAYSDYLEAARIKMFEQMEGAWQRSGNNIYELGGMINRMTGTISAAARGVGVNRRFVERTAGFAPNYLRASFMLVGDLMGRGARAKEAQSSLAALLGVGFAVFYAEEKIRGREPKIKPWPKRLGGDGAEAFTTVINGQRVGIGSWMYGMIKTLAEIGAIAADDPSALVVWNNEHPLNRFVKSKGGPGVQLANELATGKNFWGKPFETPNDYLLRVVKSLTPLAAQSLLEKESPAQARSFAERATPIAASLLGARTFPYTLRSEWTDAGYFKDYEGIPTDNDVRKAKKLPLSRTAYRTTHPETDARLFIAGEVTALQSFEAVRIAQRLLEENKIDPDTVRGIKAAKAQAEKRNKLGLRDTEFTPTDDLLRALFGEISSPKERGLRLLDSPQYQQLPTYQMKQDAIRQTISPAPVTTTKPKTVRELIEAGRR